jgi:hypothetical protein
MWKLAKIDKKSFSWFTDSLKTIEIKKCSNVKLNYKSSNVKQIIKIKTLSKLIIKKII